MTKRQMEKVLPGVLSLLRERAHHFAKKTNRPFDDWMTEAYYGFWQACDKWTTEKNVKFSTWCYRKVTCHLLYMQNKWFSDRHVAVSEVHDDLIPLHQHHAPAAFRSTIIEQARDLSPEAQKMIHFLINTPQADEDIDPRQLLRDACDHLAFEHGYDEVQLAIAKNDIKMALMSK